VFNSCNTGDASGALRTITGTASDDDKNTNAKFTVSFEGVPFKGSYWVIGIDSMYRYAVVSDKGGGALYILSKTPTLTKNFYDEAVAIGAKQVDISSLAVTDQTNCAYPK
jgi:apolipoprotein D and lipocalin family protein